MLKRSFVWLLIVALVGLAVPAPVLAAGGQATGQISGIARDDTQKPLANHTVRLINLTTRQVVATVQTNASGEFTFTGLVPDRYRIEVVDPAGTVIGTSGTQTLTTAVLARNDVSVFGSVRNAVGGSFFDSSAGLLLAAALGAGVTTGVGASRNNASPSK